MKPSELIDPADRLRLESAVLEAERGTAGELVVVVVRACDEYGSAGWRAGVLLALLAYLGLAAARPELPLWTYLGAQGVGLALGHALCRSDAMRRRLVAESLLEQRVAQRARRAFAEQGLEHTRERTGILIFVALLERRVVVLADEGIDRAVAPGHPWQEVVDLAVAGLRAGSPADGLLAAVHRCGEILAAHVPPPPGDLDELANPVVLED